MARAVMGGMAVGTVSDLVVIPVIYIVVEHARSEDEGVDPHQPRRSLRDRPSPATDIGSTDRDSC